MQRVYGGVFGCVNEGHALLGVVIKVFFYDEGGAVCIALIVVLVCNEAVELRPQYDGLEYRGDNEMEQSVLKLGILGVFCGEVLIDVREVYALGYERLVIAAVGVDQGGDEVHPVQIAEKGAVLPVAQAAQTLPETTQAILFWCFALAFWVKTPLFPLHGWQAQTYAEAPAGLSAVLTGAMSKAGVYGFYFWVLAIFPAASFQNAKLLMGMGLLTALYGAFMAMRAKDIKKLLAFSSMSHLGLAIAGLFTLSIDVFPALLVLLVGHGLSASALFILSGSAERFAGHRLLDKMGGLANRNPVFAFFFGIASVLAIAIPGTAGFIGEFLVLVGLWGVCKVAAVVAGICIILTGVYMLRLIQKVLFGLPGEISEEQQKLRFPIADAVATAPLLLLLIVFGIHPQPISRTLDYTTSAQQQEEEIEAAISAAAVQPLSAEDSAKIAEVMAAFADSSAQVADVQLDSATNQMQTSEMQKNTEMKTENGEAQNDVR